MEDLPLSKLIAIAEMFRKVQKLDKCETILRRAIELHPREILPALCLSKLLLQRNPKGDIDTLDESLEVSMSALDKSRQVGRDSNEAYAFITGLLLKMKRPADALTWCEQGLRLDACNDHCYFNLNTALRQLNRIQDSFRRIEEVLYDRYSLCFSDMITPMFDLETKAPADMVPDTLCIVLIKYGSKYGPEYVNRLAAGLHRHHNKENTPPFRIVCFTDDASGVDLSLVECRLLPVHQPDDDSAEETSVPWVGWWHKAYIFSFEAALPPGRVAYIDLDTVVVGDWSFIVTSGIALMGSAEQSLQSKFLIMSAESMQNTEGRACGFNSSVMVWSDAEGGRYNRLYDILRRHYRAITSVFFKFDHFLEFVFMRSSDRKESFAFIDSFFPEKIIDYLSIAQVAEALSQHCLSDAQKGGDGNAHSQQQLPDSAVMVTFPIYPKPHDVVSIVPWVNQLWS